MAYKLRCPECYSDDLEVYTTPTGKDRFVCQHCKVKRPMNKMAYEKILGDNAQEKYIGGFN